MTMTPEQLLRLPIADDAATLDAASLESDPFTDEDAFDEAQLLDVRLDTVAGRVGVLIELRVAMGFARGTAALLVVHGSRGAHLQLAPAEGRMAREIGSVVIERRADSFRLALNMGDESFVVAGEDAAFYVLDVDGLPDVPPDYTGDNEAAIQAALPQWHSACSVLEFGRLSRLSSAAR